MAARNDTVRPMKLRHTAAAVARNYGDKGAAHHMSARQAVNCVGPPSDGAVVRRMTAG